MNSENMINEEKKKHYPLVSVVIPVYNAEKYIRDNVDSVIRQTYPNIEVIYVCDGCTDDTVSILYEYVTCSKIKIINRSSNIGAAMSRNEGLQVATGEWVIFWDADDLVKNTAIEIMLYEAIRYDADMAICAVGNFGEESAELNNLLFECLKKNMSIYPIWDNSKAKIFDLSMQMVCNAPYNKLIKKSLLKIGNIYFQNIGNCNDIYYSVSSFLNSKRIVYVDEKMYWYRNDSVGNVSSKRVSTKSYILDALAEVRRLFTVLGYEENIFRNYARTEIMGYRYEKVFDDIIDEYSKKYESQWRIPLDSRLLYVFEGKELINEKRVIIFGAGQVGRDYIEDIRSCSEIVCCLDSGYTDTNVKRVDEINDYEFDYVIIATKSDYIAKNMYDTLLNLNIEPAKIIMQYPRYLNVIE